MSIARRLFVLLYMAVIAMCLLMLVKPGAAIFFTKRTIENQDLKADMGYAYRYMLIVDPDIFRVQGTLVFEDGQALLPTTGSEVVNTGKGTYSIEEPEPGTAYIYFSAADNSNPISNGKEYTLYLPLTFVSRAWAGIYLLVLLSGVAWAAGYILSNPERRLVFTGSWRGVIPALDDFFDYIARLVGADTDTTSERLKKRSRTWLRLLSTTFLAAFLYAVMEFIFFATKPSFMSIMSIWEKGEILILSGLAFALVGVIALVIVIIPDFLAALARLSRYTKPFGLLIPTVILSSLALLLIDNFTYTVFNFGISTATGIWRGVYGLVFILLAVYIYARLLVFLGVRTSGKPPADWQWRRLHYFSTGLLVISAVIAVIRLDVPDLRLPEARAAGQPSANRPNIILLGGDGLNVEHLSVYGYERDTTPWLRELAQSALVAENAISNSGNSPGSVISIFTSKLPTTTRVAFSPDILTGKDAFEHLPGILKGEGYTSVELGVPNYVDAYSFNLQNGFDLVNGRTLEPGELSSLVRSLGYDSPAYFVDQVSERISERIEHIFYLEDMQNPYHIVTKPPDSYSDEEKINQALEIIDRSNEPVFLHLHLLGTHGAWFHPKVQVYSQGKEQDGVWMDDFYDDAILEFDQLVGRVITHLEDSGELDNTILIIYSDHRSRWKVDGRVPLIIRFPGGRYPGRVTNNVQNLDIAPTILEYLEQPEPGWMDGTSFLRQEPEPHRLIFSSGTSIGTKKAEYGWLKIDEELSKPPFYQFSYLNVTDCQKWYTIKLDSFEWEMGDITGHTSPCSEDSLYSFDEIRQAMIDQLSLDGFDTTSFP